VFAEMFNVRKKSVVLLGAILPDLLPKLVLLELFVPIPNWDYTLLSAFHVPFVLFLVILLLAPLFRYRYARIVWWLSLGTFTHLLSDTLLRHFQGGIAWLYPFSVEKYALHWVWPDQSYLILMPALLSYLTIILIKKRWSGNDQKYTS
jgi:membrane-bound metal-dependent hydrolase YbcI (DUF457 family)